jgi:fumarylacetoacetate (FAA) hydrolase
MLGEPLQVERLAPPLPRAYEWIDASAYLSHVIRVRKARGAEPPATLLTDPLVYQGGSGVLLSARAPLVLPDPTWGLDFEGELCAVLGDTPRATASRDAGQYIRLFMLANDVTYRNLVPAELDKGFGFFSSKPATAHQVHRTFRAALRSRRGPRRRRPGKLHADMG